ncbi:methyltransferase family protein [Desulfosarcina sp.]|uniref:methyltransferase family protein n=1 Tax=Desulfosarcina sp. TaxID=2027861 RepID=UPI003970C650
MPQDVPSECKLTAVDEAQAVHGAGGQLISRKPGAFALIAGAYLLGGGGMLAWLAFLLMGPLVPLDFGLGGAGALFLDTLLCLLFFTQHSIMVRRRFRLWLTRRVRADFHGALYASASGICLLALVGLWQPVGSALWTPAGPVRWLFLTIFMAAGAGAWWGSRSLGDFDALGVKPALRAFDTQKPTPANPLIVRGPYRWVRHPLYLFSLIIIWSGPIFTADRLLHNLIWTVWIVIGAGMEERDLVDCFGNAYRSYQQSVPMLFPKSLKPSNKNFGATPENSR